MELLKLRQTPSVSASTEGRPCHACTQSFTLWVLDADAENAVAEGTTSALLVMSEDNAETSISFQVVLSGVTSPWWPHTAGDSTNLTTTTQFELPVSEMDHRHAIHKYTTHTMYTNV